MVLGKLEQEMRKFSDRQLDLMMSNVGSIQLTDGCSSACPDCGVGALPGVRDRIPFSLLEDIFTRFSKQLAKQDPLLFYASEPFDYRDGGHDFPAVARMAKRLYAAKKVVKTSVPKGWAKKIVEHVFTGRVFPDMNYLTISLTKVNFRRVDNALAALIPGYRSGEQMAFPSRYEKHSLKSSQFTWHEGSGDETLGERMVLMNLDEIAGSLGCKPSEFALGGRSRDVCFKPVKGYWNETNSYMAFKKKHGREPVGEEYTALMKKHRKISRRIFHEVHSSFSIYADEQTDTEGTLHVVRLPNGTFLAEESQRVSFRTIMDYVRSSSFCNQLPEEFTSWIADFLGERGENEVHAGGKRLGPKYLDNLSDEPIGCFHGVLVTPRGFFNVKTMVPSGEFPYGQCITPIAPDGFRVAEFRFTDSYGKEHLQEEAEKYNLLS